MESNCPQCGVSIEQADVFCRRCGTSLSATSGGEASKDSFQTDLLALLKRFSEFRRWIDQRKKTNIRFMRAYKIKLVDEIGLSFRQFKDRYHDIEGEKSKRYEFVLEIFTCFNRPITFMETTLRPSVSIGIWQERWMMTKTVEDYLKQCCQEADHLVDELARRLTTDKVSYGNY